MFSNLHTKKPACRSSSVSPKDISPLSDPLWLWPPIYSAHFFTYRWLAPVWKKNMRYKLFCHGQNINNIKRELKHDSPLFSAVSLMEPIIRLSPTILNIIYMFIFYFNFFFRSITAILYLFTYDITLLESREKCQSNRTTYLLFQCN